MKLPLEPIDLLRFGLARDRVSAGEGGLDRLSAALPLPCWDVLIVGFMGSLRDVEDLLAERGVAMSYETVRRSVRLVRTRFVLHASHGKRHMSALPENTGAQSAFSYILAEAIEILEHTVVCDSRVPQMIH